MPRLFSRLPASSQSPIAKALVSLALFCCIAALVCYFSFSATTETSGHLWWKETREIPWAERRPYLIAVIAFVTAAAVGLVGSLELCIAVARRTDSQTGLGPDASTSISFVLTRAAGRSWRRARGRRAELLAAAVAQRVATQEAAAQRRYERSTAGQAEKAYETGAEFFSIDLDIDEELAQHLNAIHDAGWRRHGLSRRHRNPSQSVQAQTFIFRRAARAGDQ